MKINHLATNLRMLTLTVALAAASILGVPNQTPKEAQAQSSNQACRDVVTPTAGLVCYTEHPFYARQRGEGGTQDHKFIVERIAPNWVIVDYKVHNGKSFGAYSLPTGSTISATGNVAIVTETRQAVERLNQVRSRLRASGQTAELNAINQQIESLSRLQNSAIQAGGNEKILFNYTTSVTCRLGICGGGAQVRGVVVVYQRYLGDPDRVRQQSLQLVNAGRVTGERGTSLPSTSRSSILSNSEVIREASVSKPPPGNVINYYGIKACFLTRSRTLFVGKVHQGYCNYARSGREERAENYSVIMSVTDFFWRRNEQGIRQARNQIGGRPLEVLYIGEGKGICGVHYRGGYHVGLLKQQVCTIGYGGDAVEFEQGDFDFVLYPK